MINLPKDVRAMARCPYETMVGRATVRAKLKERRDEEKNN
jgi:hypothetical protein